MAVPRRVVVLALPRSQALDIAGPIDVFASANERVAPGYGVELVTRGGGAIRCSSGLMVAAGPLPQPAPLDTLIVVGGEDMPAAARVERGLADWIAATAVQAQRTVSVCTGAFLLAAAGLLDGRRATTHWTRCEDLARMFPRVQVEPDRIFVRDGAIGTSAGVTAGIDLTLALVEEDFGREIALDVARAMVVYLKRPGGQSQFSAQIAGQLAARQPLRELQAWIADHLDEDLSVPALAHRAYMSERNFARAFRRETGLTPAAYVEALRVESARTALQESRAPTETIARGCGFGSAEVMRRAFQRRLGIPPTVYRERFAATG
jgi:transcriptional regulator GlxA family with amidase domain